MAAAARRADDLDAVHSTPAPRNSGWASAAPWIALLLAVAVAALASHAARPWIVDDALISMRYARHLAEGHGLVYNPGERVEGYTSFLWVSLLGVLHACGAPLPQTAQWLGPLFALATLVLLARTHRHVPGAGYGTSVAAVLLAGSAPIFGLWSQAGMEVPLVGFLLVLALFLHLRSKRHPKSVRRGVVVGLVTALATLARPECALAFALLGADRLADLRRSGWRPLLGYGAGFAALFAPHFAWSWLYYGYPFPNTFYAKVGSGLEPFRRGYAYTLLFGTACLPVVALALAGAIACLGLARRFPGALLPLLGIVGLHTLYVLRVGGDFMPATRFYASHLPLVALLAALALTSLAVRPGHLAAALAGVLLLDQLQLYQHPALLQRIRQTRQISAGGEFVGRWMRDHLPPDTLLATNTAGSVAFYSRLRTIDMLGLNDSHIAHLPTPGLGTGLAAHEKADGAYVFARRPDVVHLGSAFGARTPQFRSDRELVAQPGFAEHYELLALELPGARHAYLWIRSDWEHAAGVRAALGGAGVGTEAQR